MILSWRQRRAWALVLTLAWMELQAERFTLEQWFAIYDELQGL